MWNYVGRFQARGIEPQVHMYTTGHASYDVEERVRQTAVVLDYLARTVPGIRRLDGVDALLPEAAGGQRRGGSPEPRAAQAKRYRASRPKQGLPRP